MLLGDVSLRAMHRLHMFTQRAWICVPLSTAGDLTYIGFLQRSKAFINIENLVTTVLHTKFDFTATERVSTTDIMDIKHLSVSLGKIKYGLLQNHC